MAALPVPVLQLLCSLLLLLTATTAQAQQDAPDGGHCVWYGQCGPNPAGGGQCNCPYNGTAKPLLDDTATAVLSSICPELVEDIGVDSNGTLSTCCSADQVTALALQMAMGTGLLARCPSCVWNFRLTYCYMTCAPHQSNYMTIAETAVIVIDNTTKTIITELDLAISEEFADGVYDSCKDVSMPSTNEKVMSIMCGPWGSFYCNADRWFNYMGSPKNGFAPFLINYIFNNETSDKVFSKDLVPCNEKPTNTSRECGCVDCQAACPLPPPPPPEPVVGWQLLLICGGVGFLATIMWLTMLCCNIFERRDRSESAPVVWWHYKCPGRIGHRISATIRICFVRLGQFVGEYPWAVVPASVLVVLVSMVGLMYTEITTNPVELWAAPNSASRTEKQYYDEHFEPFYRTEMLIIRPVGLSPVKQDTPDGIKTWGPVFNKEFLLAVADLQNYIQDEIIGDDNTTLSDICFKPLSPANDDCVIQSVLNYFQNDPENLDRTSTDSLGYNVTYLNHMDVCFRNPVTPVDTALNISCLGSYGGPVFPYTAVGGFLKNGSTDLGLNPAYHEATALVITFVVNNHLNSNETLPAMDWEKQFLQFMSNYSHPLLDVAYTAERAVQDELERESHGDIYTILISYVLMFLYIVISIGQLSSCSRLPVDSKITLGLTGVLIVLASVLVSVAIYGFIGVPATLIIIEVIPFLVLAVGVDNMFLIVSGVQAAEKLPTESRAEQLGRVMGDVAPALLISTGSEAACFFLGALSPMPAVRAFALYAGMALTVDFLLQITVFLAVVTLDQRRQESNRMDVLCCVKLYSLTPSVRSDGILTRFMRDHYAKLLTKKWVKALVIFVFAAWSMTSLPFLGSIEVGLDQQLSMPEDSYLQKYFGYLGEYLSVGPPVYFVVKPGVEFGESLEAQNKVCGTIDCGNQSLVTQLYLASRIANRSSIARPASSWLDDYISWSVLNMGENSYADPCCRLYDNGTFCPSTDYESYCQNCDIQLTDSGLRPTPESFDKYLQFFLEDNPSASCPKGGHAAYSNAVNLVPDPAHGGELSAGANYFMTYHTILRTSRDYYTALIHAREIAANITVEINSGRAPNETVVEVFPYSVFYVFYEQYLTIFDEAVVSMFLSIGTVFVVMLVFSGFDFYSSAIVAVGLIVLVINMGGCMYWFDVSLNAVSLVNLVMSVGIFVEFLSHMAFAFARVDHPDPDHRMVEALAHTGASVFSGITLTKIVGVSVLAFAHSQIFKVFYFRMYLFIIVLGATHGLIWMPVLLSILGKHIPASSQHANTHTFTRITEDFYTPSHIHEEASSPHTSPLPAHQHQRHVESSPPPAAQHQDVDATVQSPAQHHDMEDSAARQHNVDAVVHRTGYGEDDGGRVDHDDRALLTDPVGSKRKYGSNNNNTEEDADDGVTVGIRGSGGATGGYGAIGVNDTVTGVL